MSQEKYWYSVAQPTRERKSNQDECKMHGIDPSTLRQELRGEKLISSCSIRRLSALQHLLDFIKFGNKNVLVFPHRYNLEVFLKLDLIHK